MILVYTIHPPTVFSYCEKCDENFHLTLLQNDKEKNNRFTE